FSGCVARLPVDCKGSLGEVDGLIPVPQGAGNDAEVAEHLPTAKLIVELLCDGEGLVELLHSFLPALLSDVDAAQVDARPRLRAAVAKLLPDCHGALRVLDRLRPVALAGIELPQARERDSLG